ncbi:hypothetical protein HY572_06800 [Candidatus Micrarchaeota archaeon]|nr:hypothetical protein [Candidatus Micrarchaeota archaeon]
MHILVREGRAGGLKLEVRKAAAVREAIRPGKKEQLNAEETQSLRGVGIIKTVQLDNPGNLKLTLTKLTIAHFRTNGPRAGITLDVAHPHAISAGNLRTQLREARELVVKGKLHTKAKIQGGLDKYIERAASKQTNR